MAELARAKRVFREAKAEVGDSDGPAELADKKPEEPDEDVPALSSDELDMSDRAQKEEYAKIQAEYQQAQQ